MNGSILVDHPAPNVTRVLINRPEKRNAINEQVRQGFANALAVAAADHSTRCVLLGGVGGVFSAGGDLPSMMGLDEAGARARMQHIHALCLQIVNLPVPVISAIEGIAAGGAVGMALLGDHIVAADDARILFPFLALGLTPDWGQLLTLPQRVGLSAARRILTSGRAIDGREAQDAGLVDVAVSPDAVMQTAIDTAVRFAALPSAAFVRTRHRLMGGIAQLTDELRREEEDQTVCLTSAEFKEGFAAFADRRAPNFAGLDAHG